MMDTCHTADDHTKIYLSVGVVLPAFISTRAVEARS